MRKIFSSVSSSTFLMGAVAMLIVGCSPSEETVVDPNKSWIDKEGTAVASDIAFDFDGLLFKSAKEVHSYDITLKDKVLSGTFKVENLDIDGNPVSDAQGEVICLVFEDDCRTTRITGVITSGSDPTYLGKYAVWTVVDEGGDKKLTTDIRYPVDEATSKYHCEFGLDLAWYNLTALIPVTGSNLNITSDSCN